MRRLLPFLSLGYRAAAVLIWSLAVLALPVSSFPVLKELSGATTVAPLSSALFAVLLLFWFIPFVLRKGRIPAESQPFLLYLVVVVVTWLAAFFLQHPPFREGSVFSEAKEAFVTLILGAVAFFLPAAWISRGKKELRLTFQMINLGGALVIGWCAVQAYYAFLQNGAYPGILYDIQDIFSTRSEGFFPGRVTGFAYEPSWLAHQLNLVYLSFWLSASLRGFSVHRRIFWRLSVENVLLAAGVVTLVLSLSRVGILSFFLVLLYLTVRFSVWASKKLHHLVRSRLKPRTEAPTPYQGVPSQLGAALFSSVLVILVLFLMAASAYGMFLAGAKFDPRMQRIAEQDFSTVTSVYEISNKLAFAERVVYWATGLEVFADHPILGVGLGNTGFYFPQKMPVFGYALWEVSDLINYSSVIPNTKSYWVRILSETGLVGFGVFLAWLYLLWNSGGLAERTGDPLLKTAGLAGKFVLVAFVAEGFSVDSYALPYIWFSTGMLAAVGMLSRRWFQGEPRAA